MATMYHAEDIAKWFLAKNQIDINTGKSDERISNLKLQKLLYYAQGCVLAITGSPLFSENILAWEHGPVVSEIYHKYKSNGNSGIPYEEDFDMHSIDKETRNILDSVFQEFGQYTASKLRNMTHNESPWKNTKKGEIIPNSEIKKYFEEHYVE